MSDDKKKTAQVYKDIESACCAVLDENKIACEVFCRQVVHMKNRHSLAQDLCSKNLIQEAVAN